MTRTTGHMSRRVLVSALSLLFGTAAHAGFYPGHLEPPGNGTVPGFTGDTVFTISDNCFATDGWHATNNGGSGPQCTGSVYSATIDLYSTGELDPPTPGTILGRFVLGEGVNYWPILGVFVEDGLLAGVDTTAMGSEPGMAVGDHTDWVDHNFWLQFVSGQCPTDGPCTAPGHFPEIDPAYISMDDINTISNPGTVIFGPACRTDPNGAPIDCVITATVPEPGTLALLFGALGGGWLARRRKRNAAT